MPEPALTRPAVDRAPATTSPSPTHAPAPLPAPPAFSSGGLGLALSALDPTARAHVLGAVQRTAGNQGVQQLVPRPVVQRCTAHSICPECAARGETAEGKPLQGDWRDRPIKPDWAVQGDWLDDAKKAGAAGLDMLSEQARLAVQIFSCLPMVRAIAIVGSVEAAVLDMFVAHVKAGTMPSAAEAQVLLPLVEKALITSVCNCLPDPIVTGIALHVYLVGQPLAQRHLQHYLTGGGADFKEDINDLFTRNPTIRNNVASQIGEQSNTGTIKKGVLQGGGDLPGGGNLPGFPPITQDDYDDQDWRNSIGNVDRLDWTIVAGPDATGNATVRISLSDPYAWHPKEARLTQCVHQAIENMKKRGAQEYMARGTGDIVINLGSSFKPGPNAGPR